MHWFNQTAVLLVIEELDKCCWVWASYRIINMKQM